MLSIIALCTLLYCSQPEVQQVPVRGTELITVDEQAFKPVETNARRVLSTAKTEVLSVVTYREEITCLPEQLEYGWYRVAGASSFAYG